MTEVLTVTIHAASVWAFLGRLAVTLLVGYLVLCLVMLTTMDSGWWLPWPLGLATMAAVVYGVWLA